MCEILRLIHYNDIEPLAARFKGQLSIERIDRIKQFRFSRLLLRSLKVRRNHRSDDGVPQASVECVIRL